MGISKHSDPSCRIDDLPFFSKNSKRQTPGLASAAFSLVEVTVAIGIVAFAFVAIFALLPTGMRVFRQSINTTVTSQIAQRILNDAQQTDFEALIKDGGNSVILGAHATGRKAVRFFDDQGNEQTSSTDAIYWANTRITPATPLPNTGIAAQDVPYLATVTVQVAHNPANAAPVLSSASADNQAKPLRNLWTNNPVGEITTYSALVSRNQ